MWTNQTNKPHPITKEASKILKTEESVMKSKSSKTFQIYKVAEVN